MFAHLKSGIQFFSFDYFSFDSTALAPKPE
jgi:hypothetical protein